jgi:hypothetical protein
LWNLSLKSLWNYFPKSDPNMFYKCVLITKLSYLTWNRGNKLTAFLFTRNCVLFSLGVSLITCHVTKFLLPKIAHTQLSYFWIMLCFSKQAILWRKAKIIFITFVPSFIHSLQQSLSAYYVCLVLSQVLWWGTRWLTSFLRMLAVWCLLSFFLTEIHLWVLILLSVCLIRVTFKAKTSMHGIESSLVKELALYMNAFSSAIKFWYFVLLLRC